jgi:hypothetical protein
MDKAIEAAMMAYNTSDFDMRAAIRAYLSALKEDPDVVERVARAQVSYLYPTDEGYPGYDDLVPEAVEILSSCARAALSALEVE